MLTPSCRPLRALLRFLGFLTTLRTRSLPPLAPGGDTRARRPSCRPTSFAPAAVRPPDFPAPPARDCRSAARRPSVAADPVARRPSSLAPGHPRRPGRLGRGRPGRPTVRASTAPASTAAVPARARHVRRSRPRARCRTPDAAMITGCGAERPRGGRLTPQPVIMRPGREPNRVARTGSTHAAPPGFARRPEPSSGTAHLRDPPGSTVPAGAELVKAMPTRPAGRTAGSRCRQRRPYASPGRLPPHCPVRRSADTPARHADRAASAATNPQVHE